MDGARVLGIDGVVVVQALSPNSLLALRCAMQIHSSRRAERDGNRSIRLRRKVHFISLF